LIIKRGLARFGKPIATDGADSSLMPGAAAIPQRLYKRTEITGVRGNYAAPEVVETITFQIIASTSGFVER
jgi:hypothetical protein